MVSLSGVSGLSYQVLWVRSLSFTFGVTTVAVTSVLAGFMAGLALGSYLAGRAIDRVRQPLVVYGVIEIAIGLVGLLSLQLFAALPSIYQWLPVTAGQDAGDVTGSVVRVVLAFLIILVPTTLMGATLPVVVKSSLLRSQRLHRDVGLLYAANTGGAIVGTLAAGFVLIGAYGMQQTATFAASLNLTAGVMALALAPLVRPRADERSAAISTATAAATTVAPSAETNSAPSGIADSLAPPRRFVLVVAWVYALSGFCALAYEVVWNRLLSLVFDGTTYPFTIMLATVLAGIAAGSYAVSPFLSLRINWGLVFAVLQVLLGLSVTAALWVFGHLHALVAWVDEAGLPVPLSPEDQVAAIVSLSTIFPAAFIMGIGFPVAARLYATREGQAGRQVGGIYAANVFGAIFGSFVAGFILIPRLGSQPAMVALAGLNLALGGVLLALLRRPSPWVRLALAAAAVAAFVALAGGAPDLRTRLLPGAVAGGQLVWHAEDKAATVSVTDIPGQGRMLYVDSRPQAHDARGPVQLHQLLAHFPLLLHHAPRDVLVVGLGGGVTPGAVAEHRGVRVDVVELVPGVVPAAGHFSHVNGDVLNQPNVRITVDDGRNFLLRAAHTNRRYDVITADIIRPHHAGAGNLYSIEYYRLAAAVLREDGVMMQWLDPHPRHRHQLMVRTFMAAFPYATLWLNGDLLVGSKQPLTVSGPALARRVRESGLSRETLESLGIGEGPEMIDQWFLARDAELRAYAGEGPILSDDRPVMEYFRSLSPDNTPLDTGVFSRRS